MRYDASLVKDDLDILTRGVKHLQHGFVRHQVEERLQVDAVGERIDDNGLVRARQLDHAEQRVIRRLAQKLGIDCNDAMFGEAAADICE